MSGSCHERTTIHAYGRPAQATVTKASRGSLGSSRRRTGRAAASRPGVANTISGQWLARLRPYAAAAPIHAHPRSGCRTPCNIRAYAAKNNRALSV